MDTHIGRFKLNFDRNEITHYVGGEIQLIKMEPAPMKVLSLLVSNPQRVVSRDTFIEEIWDGNDNVGNPALSKCISKIRSVLVDQDLIQTVPKTGYTLHTNPKANVEFGYNRFLVSGKKIAIGIVLIGLVFWFFRSHFIHKITHQLFF